MGIHAQANSAPGHPLPSGLGFDRDCRGARLGIDTPDVRVVSRGYRFVEFIAATGMLLQMGLHGIDIVLSIWFVHGLGWGVPGAAIATVVGQGAAAIAGLALLLRHYGGVRAVLGSIAPGELLGYVNRELADDVGRGHQQIRASSEEGVVADDRGRVIGASKRERGRGPGAGRVVVDVDHR